METPAIIRSETSEKKPLSYEEYLALPDESRIIEWVDGEVVYHVPPTPDHQKDAFLLAKILSHYVNRLGLGAIFMAPLEVKLWPGGPAREPDILYISNDKLDQMADKRYNGAPDLIVEVVSPSSLTLDRVTKFREYERAGVGEYWIIDPRPFQQQADFYIRDEDGRFAPAPIDGEGVYHSHVVPGFRLQVGWLWQSPPVDPERAAAWILADAPGLSDELRAVYREMLRLLE